MSSFIVKDTPGGMKTLLYRNGREVRIHSAYDPVREAERAVEGFSVGRASMIAVSVLGLGYHIGALRSRFPGITIIAFERDGEVVSIAREACPEFLEGVRVIGSPGELSSIFEEIDMSGFRGVAHYIHRPSYLLHAEFYDALYREMSQYVSSKISDFLTRFEFEERWVENILRNLPHLFFSARVGRLFGTFRGVPGIIVSAGPSLRGNEGPLSLMRERGLIVAVDTAAPVLQKMGVVPHIIMTLDAQKHSIKHFLGLRREGSALCPDMVCHPPVMRDFRGRRIISTTSKYYTSAGGVLAREATPLMEWVENHVGPIGDVQSGGSVATSAFDLLLNLGCSTIILVGQDLAYTGREIHCSGTHHNDEWLPRSSRVLNLDTINQNVIRRRKIKYVPAYGGEGLVISDFVFDLYRSWFEDSAGKVGVEVINATGGGARIAGTREEPLASIAGRLAFLKPAPSDILDRVLSGDLKGDPEEMARAIRAAIGDLEELRGEAAGAIAGTGT
ncbi:MAG: DUF115 domain-containing protein, partial [Chrysiogenales bacterium]